MPPKNHQYLCQEIALAIVWDFVSKPFLMRVAKIVVKCTNMLCLKYHLAVHSENDIGAIDNISHGTGELDTSYGNNVSLNRSPTSV